MASDAKKPPKLSETKPLEKNDREDRLAAALRDNLRKRKEQSRARATAAGRAKGEC